MSEGGCLRLKDGKDCLDPLAGPPCEIAEFCATRRDWERGSSGVSEGGCPWLLRVAGSHICRLADDAHCVAEEAQTTCETRAADRGARCMFNEKRRCHEGCVAHQTPGGCGLLARLGDIAESLTMIIHHVRNLGG